MPINSFRLVNFKNHPDFSCECRDVNVFIGKNGSGKTNILEAVYFLVNARMLPGQQIMNTIRTDEDSLFLSMTIIRDGIPMAYSITYDVVKKRGNYLLAGSSVSRDKYSISLGKRAIFFSPQEMNMLYLGPDGRRDFLDEALSLTFPAFIKVKSEYTRVLKQRNKLLKNIVEGKADRADLKFWDVTLAKTATVYYGYRFQLTDYILAELPSLEHLLEDKYRLGFHYSTKIDRGNITDSIREYLNEKQERDLILGYTYIGPHLDDFSFQINMKKGTRDSTEYLSRGENKTLLLGLKILVIRFLEKYTTSQICILLDDLFSELDNDHIRLVLEACGQHQIFITNQNMSDLSLPDREIMVRNII